MLVKWCSKTYHKECYHIWDVKCQAVFKIRDHMANLCWSKWGNFRGENSFYFIDYSKVLALQFGNQDEHRPQSLPFTLQVQQGKSLSVSQVARSSYPATEAFLLGNRSLTLGVPLRHCSQAYCGLLEFHPPRCRSGMNYYVLACIFQDILCRPTVWRAPISPASLGLQEFFVDWFHFRHWVE